MSDISKEISFPPAEKFDENLFKKFRKLNKKGKNIFSQVGYRITQSMFFLYLLKKYKSECYLYDSNEDFRLIGVQLLIDDKEGNYNDDDKELLDSNKKHLEIMAEAFMNCVKREVKIIIIPLIIDHIGEGEQHSNVLIYRHDKNEIEHFEPHGSYYMLEEEKGKETQKVIKEFISICNKHIKKINKKQMKFIPSEEICPVIDGLQALEVNSTLTNPDGSEEDGYCAAWSFFFTEVCLRNPELNGRQIMDICLKYFNDKNNVEDYLRRVIRGYTGLIDEKIKKYLTIITGEELDVEKINEITEYDDETNYKKIVKIMFELLKLENYMLTDKNFDIEKEMDRINTELRKNRFFKNLTKEEKISLLTKKKILENYEKFNKATTKGTSYLNEDDKTTILSSVLESYGESSEEIASTITDIKSLSETTKKTQKSDKSSVISVLSEKSFQPKKRRGITKNIIETETEEESEEESFKPLNKKGKNKNVIETEIESETEEEPFQPKKKRGITKNIIKTETEESIKFPSLKTETTTRKQIPTTAIKSNKKTTKKLSSKLKSISQKSKRKIDSKGSKSKSKKSSIRVKSTNRTINEERCGEGQFFSTKEMACVNIKSYKKSPKTKINLYSLKE